MELTNKKKLKNLLAKYDIKPTKKLGQNFLVSKKALEDIVRLAELEPADQVLEVGGGVGTLTRKLASKVTKVWTVEKDPCLYQILKQESLKEFSNVEIISADIRDLFKGGILKFDHCNLNFDYKVVSNLPYYLSSFLIRKFLEAQPKPIKIVLTLQKELAERICAQPGQMSILAVAVQFYSNPSLGPTIPKTHFYPSPKVDSRILILNDICSLEDVEEESFFGVVRAGFGHKRKTLANNLSMALEADKGKVEDVLEEFGLSKMVRPQALSVEDWMRISTVLNQDLGMV